MILVPVFTSLNPGLGSPIRLKNYYLASTGWAVFQHRRSSQNDLRRSYRYTRLTLWLRLCLSWLPKKPMSYQ